MRPARLWTSCVAAFVVSFVGGQVYQPFKASAPCTRVLLSRTLRPMPPPPGPPSSGALRPSVATTRPPDALGSPCSSVSGKRALHIYFSSSLLLGDFWKRRERCWLYRWDLGLQTQDHCGNPQPAALPPALVSCSVTVTSPRPTPLALPLRQGATGLCLRVEFWRCGSVSVVPSLGALLRQGDRELPILSPQTAQVFSQRAWDPDPQGDADAPDPVAPGASLRSEHLRSASQAWRTCGEGGWGAVWRRPWGRGQAFVMESRSGAWPGRA